DEGKFSMKLLEEACNKIKGRSKGSMREVVKEPIAILVNYKDGTKGTTVMLSGYVGEGWGYAANAGGKTVACEFVLEGSTNAHFSYLALNIQNFFLTGKPSAPVERTLLTGGILDTGIRSIADGGKLVQTPFLNIQYSVEGYTSIVPAHPRPVGQSIGPWPPKGYEFIINKPAGISK
ncbi:MAG TPA: hypothetical protein VMY77_06025, partial [Chitinophagaceae bacterium]|nr:hypothetical protein [Chitinophagaceae bacterium]